MNCKPGDIARIVAPFAPAGVDHFVRVVRRAKEVETFGEFSFSHAGPSWGWVCTGSVPMDDGFVMHDLVIADECLRPIRDPGDDAIDESAAWLPPVPLPKIEPALLPAKENTNAQ